MESDTTSQPSVYALVDGEIGEKVETWLRDQDDISLEAAFSERDRLSEIITEQPDLVISAGYLHIIPEEIIEIPERGTVNLHNSYLPYARGRNSNVWSIIEDHPAGVSLHYITAEVDAGPIIARREVPIYPDDNGKTLYERMIREQFDLFVEYWEEIRDGTTTTMDNPISKGTLHRRREFDELCKLDLDRKASIDETIDLLRALTFPPYNNAYFVQDGKKYYVDIEITPENEVDD